MAGSPLKRARRSGVAPEPPVAPPPPRTGPAWADDALVARIADRVLRGWPIPEAARAEWIPRESVSHWRRRAEEPDPPTLLLAAVDAIDVARARAVGLAAERVYAGQLAPLSWLERMERETWGRHDRVTMDGSGPASGAEIAAALRALLDA